MRRLFGLGMTFLLGSGAIFTGTAAAGGRVETTVTIRAENGDFSGFVKSSNPSACADGRKVVLFKQTGSEPSPSTDDKVASDTASLNGDKYQWSTGNTGMSGKFYARVAKTAECKGDLSPTVRSQR